MKFWGGRTDSSLFFFFVVASLVSLSTAAADGVSVAATASDTEAIERSPDQARGLVEIFSVYLFSSRSSNAADDVNQRFRQAGFESQVIKISDGTEARYRVAVSGFPSRQAAQKFADSVVGSYGITDTWIGQDTR